MLIVLGHVRSKLRDLRMGLPLLINAMLYVVIALVLARVEYRFDCDGSCVKNFYPYLFRYLFAPQLVLLFFFMVGAFWVSDRDLSVRLLLFVSTSILVVAWVFRLFYVWNKSFDVHFGETEAVLLFLSLLVAVVGAIVSLGVRFKRDGLG